MNKKVGKWLFLGCVLSVASMVILWLSYLNINTRTAYAKNGRLTLYANSIADGFVLLDGQLLVSNGMYTPEDAEDADWYLSSDLRYDTQMEYRTYRLNLTVEDGSGICFLALQPANIRMWINGIELPEKQLESNRIYHFSEFNSLGNNEYYIWIQVGEITSRRNHYHGLMFGSQEQLITVQMAWVASGMIAIGIYILLVIQSLALYLQKRSESYLLILALIVLHAGLRGITISVFPLLSIFWPGAELGDLTSSLFRLAMPLNLFLLANIFPKDVGRKVLTIGIVVSVGGVICAIFRFWEVNSIALTCYYVVDLVMLFLETICILKSFMRDRNGSRVLLAGVFGYIGGRVFAALISEGLIPIGMVDTYYYPWQYSNLIYLVSYAVAIDGIFTRKFSEADILSAKIQSVNANLEQIIAERTLELEEMNQKLTEKNQALIQFQQAKQEFLGNVVHNLRTPLFTLGVTIDMLQEDDVDSPQYASRLKKIKKKIDYIQCMIKDLFFIVRIDDRRVRFDLKQQDLNPLLTQVCLDYQAKAQQKDLALQLLLPEYPTSVAFDGLYFRQAIENILDNAIRHSIMGMPIQVSTVLSGNMAQISIKNYGEPISSEDLPHIFERYYRGKGNQPEQTGLGLAIAQEIVSEHEGTITVKSDERGTCFTICLPVDITP